MDSSQAAGPVAPSSPATKPTAATPQSSGVRGGRNQGASAIAPAPTLNQIRLQCLMNMDYHAAREAWLDGLHRWLMFIVIAAGASALVDLSDGARLIGPVIAAIAGALDLTFDLSNRARAHSLFRRRYGETLTAALRNPDDLTERDAELQALWGEEEPPFNALLALCQDRADLAVHGNAEFRAKVGPVARILMNVRRYPGRDFHA